MTRVRIQPSGNFKEHLITVKWFNTVHDIYWCNIDHFLRQVRIIYVKSTCPNRSKGIRVTVIQSLEYFYSLILIDVLKRQILFKRTV